ncbi:PP2C family protein-serine/threonine phosphatase [Thiovibrio sp. JS02]
MFSFLKRFLPTPHRPVAFFGRTDTGRVRKHNEDSFATLRNRRIFIVADGMGGHNAGEVASRLAIEALLDYLSEERIKAMRGNDNEIRHNLLKAFNHANTVVMENSAADPSHAGMGCTLVACLLDGGTLHTCHVGDARCYVAEGGKLVQITTDHTGVTFVQTPTLTEKENQKARNVVTRAIGFPFPQDPEYHKNLLRPGARVLLCSDGLWNMVDHTRIEQMLLNAATPEEASEALVNAANEEGGRDNITALVIFA